jgi:hypothetical protein
MDDLIHMDEDCWHAKKNKNHIQLLRKNQQGDKSKMKSFEEGDLVLWLRKVTIIKGSLNNCGKGHTKCKK